MLLYDFECPRHGVDEHLAHIDEKTRKCDECGAEITDYTRKNGTVLTAKERVANSRKYSDGAVLCFDCDNKRKEAVSG